MKLSIIIPAWNEMENVEAVYRAIPFTSFKAMGYETEVIIVNTSTDYTEKIAKELGITVINEERRGYGRAYKTGFEYVTEGIVTTFDADLTYNPNEIIKMLSIYEKMRLLDGDDIFISGNRFACPDKEAFKPLNWFGNKVFNWGIWALFGVKLMDSQSGQWLTSKKAIDKLKLEQDGMALSTEVKLEAKEKLTFVEVPVGYRKRPNYSKLNPFGDGKKILRFLLKRRFGGKKNGN
jgi:glycosyltransferase involved in cell wall biosynthesis